MFIRIKMILSCALVSLSASLLGEVEYVEIKWTPGLCSESCAKNLRTQFSKTAGVASSEVSASSAQAKLHWKPNVTFSFGPINAAMSMIGLSMTELRVKVRGTIIHDAKTVTLVSLGDNTRFQLLGPTQASKTGYAIAHNINSHPLPPDTRTKLLDAQTQKQVVTVEGPLFEPERSPPLYLITEKLNVIVPETSATSK